MTDNSTPKQFSWHSYSIVFERQQHLGPDHTAFKSLTTKSLQSSKNSLQPYLSASEEKAGDVERHNCHNNKQGHLQKHNSMINCRVCPCSWIILSRKPVYEPLKRVFYLGLGTDFTVVQKGGVEPISRPKWQERFWFEWSTVQLAYLPFCVSVVKLHCAILSWKF